MAPSNPDYRGRFAPSPTGPLHLGSLIAALASFLEARSRGGVWLVRMEDLDPPREQPGAARAILSSLRDHGLHWDAPPLWQGQRGPAYRAALDRLAAQGLLFRCECNRKSLGPGGTCAGACRSRQASMPTRCATRIAVPGNARVTFRDALQGEQDVLLGQELANFVLLRKDGLVAYQLAVVVDDAAQGISHIVRGSDLLESTARQIFLQRALELPTPHYLHLPLITFANGSKLSKQNLAPALDSRSAPDNLRRALRFLHQPEPPAGLNAVAPILEFAIEHWLVQAIPAVAAAVGGELLE